MLVSEIDRIVRNNSADCPVEDFVFKSEKQNQLMFFIKPEVFLLPSVEDTLRVCQLIFEKFSDYGVTTSGAYMISGPTLEQHRTMDAHYGYINSMSRNASQGLSKDDSDHIRRELGGIDAPILGGHEVLANNPGIGAEPLNQIWSQKKSLKLRSGLYFQAFDIQGAPVVIVNGFHPSQLEHFTSGDRRLLLILLNSDLPWRFLRSRMLGDTFPERANPSSIRGTLFNDASRFGYEAVTIANNSAHLSAGPFEAAFECRNFLSKIQRTFALSSLGLAAHFRNGNLNPNLLEGALENPGVRVRGDASETRLFDATEECDAIAAVATYKQFFA